MRLFMNAWTVLGVVGALGVFGVAAAQTQPQPQVQSGQAEIVARRDVELSMEQIIAESRKAMPQMEHGSSSVRLQLEQARAAHDVVKVLCLNDKLNQIDVAMRSATDRASSLEAAATRRDQDRVRHDFAVVQVLRDRVRGLVSEANQCIGEETGFVGESTVRVDIDPTIPQDPSQYPEEPFVSIPPTVSTANPVS